MSPQSINMGENLKPYSREWMLSDRPTSRKQSRIGRAYINWRR